MYDIVITTNATPEVAKQAAMGAMARKSAGLTGIALAGNPYTLVGEEGSALSYRKTSGKETGTIMEIGITSAQGVTTMTFGLAKFRSSKASPILPGVVVSKDDLRNYARVAVRHLTKGGHTATSAKHRV